MRREPRPSPRVPELADRRGRLLCRSGGEQPVEFPQRTFGSRQTPASVSLRRGLGKLGEVSAARQATRFGRAVDAREQAVIKRDQNLGHSPSISGISGKRVSLTVPLHRELKRGTLAGILSDAGIDAEVLRRLL